MAERKPITPDFYDKANDRDAEFIKGLCGAARNLRKELREWIQGELVALITAADVLEAQSEGIIKEQVLSAAERLRIINQSGLNDANAIYDDTINEIADGGYSDVHEAYSRLQKECSQLIQIMEELLDKRPFIGGM